MSAVREGCEMRIPEISGWKSGEKKINRKIYLSASSKGLNRHLGSSTCPVQRFLRRDGAVHTVYGPMQNLLKMVELCPLYTVDFGSELCEHLNKGRRKQQKNNVKRTFLPSVRRWLSWFNSFFPGCDSNSQVCGIYFSIHVLAVFFTFFCFSLADILQLCKSGGRGWLACCCCGDLSLSALCC